MPLLEANTSRIMYHDYVLIDVLMYIKRSENSQRKIKLLFLTTSRLYIFCSSQATQILFNFSGQKLITTFQITFSFQVLLFCESHWRQTTRILFWGQTHMHAQKALFINWSPVFQPEILLFTWGSKGILSSGFDVCFVIYCRFQFTQLCIYFVQRILYHCL